MGAGVPWGPAGAPGGAGGGERARRLGRCGGERAPPPRVEIKGEASAAGGGAGPWRVSAPAPAALAAAGWEAVPQRPRPPPRALPQSPLPRQPQSRHRPLLPAPSQALRLAQLGDDGRGACRDLVGWRRFCCRPSVWVSPCLRPHFPPTGAPVFRDPFGEVVLSFPREDARVSGGGRQHPGNRIRPWPALLEPWLTLGSSGS